MKLHLIAVIIWAGILMVTSQSDSHGNWSNEKELPAYSYIYEITEGSKSSQIKSRTEIGEAENGTYDMTEKRQDEKTIDFIPNTGSSDERSKESDSTFNVENGSNYEKNETYFEAQRRLPLQLIQPYVVGSIENDSSKEEIQTDGFPEELKRLIRTNQKSANDTFTVEYFPSQEIAVQPSTASPTSRYTFPQENTTNELAYAVSEEYMDVENIGGFGQRVRAPLSHRNRNIGNFDRTKSTAIDSAGFPFEDFKKQHKDHRLRGSFSKKQNPAEDTSSGSQISPLEDVYRTSVYTDTARSLKEESRSDNLLQNNKPKLIPRLNEEDTQQSAEREYKQKKQRKPEQENTISTIKNTSNVPSELSLGKFSGPIVVPEFPGYKKLYTYAVTTENPEGNEVSSTLKSTEFPEEPVISSVKAKTLENSYLTSSSIVLNPLQVGVALVNAGQVINANNSPPEDYPPEADNSEIAVLDDKNINENDTKPEVQEDQLLQQEQISEVIAQNSPLHSVEVQKSVEIYHTAPIQEIHYPLEYVPHVPQSAKYRITETNEFKGQQKSNQVSVKNRRPVQINYNIYKSNEIAEENVIPLQQTTQERNRYEYSVHENDVNKGLSSSPSILHSNTVPVNLGKPVVEIRDQFNDAVHEQANSRLVKFKGNIEDQSVPREASKQVLDFEKSNPGNYPRPEQVPQLGQPMENPILNVETVQAQNVDVPQYLGINPQPELKLLPVIQHPVEKVIEKTVHLNHPVEVEKVIEKKVPYPLEKLIEKQVTIPQPYPVPIPIQVPVDRIVEKQIRIPQLYPIHIERVIEKKVPFAIQRFIIQPVHVKVPFPIEKPVPIPIEKVVEKTVHVARPYSVEIEKTMERRPFPLELLKLVKPHQYHNTQYEVNHQKPIARPQSFYQYNPYGLISDGQNHSNSSQIYGHGHNSYVAANRVISTRQPLAHALPKKFNTYGTHYPQSVIPYHSALNGSPGGYGRHAEDKESIKDEYVGPVPRKVQGSLGIHSKSSQYSQQDIQSLATVAPLRRIRQEGNTGSFRQSKMEYGFKPPMVPSVQYDEKTASKVD